MTPSTKKLNARSETPIWLAARPARPGSAVTVSTRSSTSRPSVASNVVTASHGLRRTGSPHSRIGRTATVPDATGAAIPLTSLSCWGDDDARSDAVRRDAGALRPGAGPRDACRARHGDEVVLWLLNRVRRR